ncbi:hypothetical protein [Saccharopolyspora gregorii]|uniref:HEAT repeat domain-containing protein n=1 Tax=Saccharopolyspora gregorii TaxID=33914 RepID=A0ABP6RMG5_9PSEU
MNWDTGEGLLAVEDPRVVDAAFDRGERHVGVAVVGISLNWDRQEDISIRIQRAAESEDRETQRMAFTALGHVVRRFRSLDSVLDSVIYRFRSSSLSEVAMDDVLQYIPFWQMPLWLKKVWLSRTLRWNLLDRWK